MKKSVITLMIFQYGCAAQQPVVAERNIITVYNDSELYSYQYISDVSCEIAANDKSVQENIVACKALLEDEGRLIKADAIHIVKEESCLKDASVDCADSSAVKMTARAHRID